MPSADMSSANNDVAVHGWTSVPRDARVVLSGGDYLHEPTSLLVQNIPFPSDDKLVVKIQKYAEQRLAPETYNHSMRTYYFGESFQEA